MTSTSQLPLFEDPVLRQLQAENAWLRQRLDNAKEAFRTLRAERDTYIRSLGAVEEQHRELDESWGRLYEENKGLRQDLRLTHEQLRLVQGICNFYRSAGLSTAPPAQRGPTREDLTQLLTLAHPDKWSQGQPATALAHELSVALNALRERLEVA